MKVFDIECMIYLIAFINFIYVRLDYQIHLTQLVKHFRDVGSNSFLATVSTAAVDDSSVATCVYLVSLSEIKQNDMSMTKGLSSSGMAKL